MCIATTYILNTEQLRVNYEATTVQLRIYYEKTTVVLQIVTTVFDTIFTITITAYYAVLRKLFFGPYRNSVTTTKYIEYINSIWHMSMAWLLILSRGFGKILL